MKTAAGLLAICLLFSTRYSPAQDGNQAAREAPPSAALEAQVGVALNSQQLLPAKPALVFVIYTSGMAEGSFIHDNDRSTAGGQYNYELERAFGANKELKAMSRRKPPLSKQEYDQMSKLSLAIVDQSLEAASNWVSKHPNQAWQIIRTAADAQGLWSVDGLHPGSYEIVVRGGVKGLDAAWEASVDLAPGQTLTLPLTRPRYLRSSGN